MKKLKKWINILHNQLRQGRSAMKQKIITAALCLVPLIWLCVLISKYEVNTFHSDQWVDELPMMAHYLDGTLSWSDFTHQNGEHKLVFPKLIELGLSILTRWNINAEIWCMIFLACLTLFNIWKICRLTGADTRLLPFVSLLLFSPLGYENWMLGYQICFWLPMACFTAVIWLAMMPYRFLTTALVSFVATFSIASGCVCWQISMAMLILKCNQKNFFTKMFLFQASLVICFALYFQDYVRQPNLNVEFILGHPSETLIYFLSYFGNPYSQGLLWVQDYQVCRIVGAGLFAIFISLFVIAWRRKMISKVFPWLGLASVSILCAALTTVGRINNPEQPSRYVPFSALFSIALLFSFNGLVKKKSFWIGIIGALTCLNLVGSIYCQNQWRGWQHFWLGNKAVTQMIGILDVRRLLVDSVIVTITNAGDTVAQIKTLDENGWVQPPLLGSTILKNRLSTADHSQYQFGMVTNGIYGMIGTAFLKDRAADAVVFASHGCIFDMVLVAPDGRWQQEFVNLSEVPEAWAWDAQTETAYKISN